MTPRSNLGPTFETLTKPNFQTELKSVDRKISSKIVIGTI